MTKFAEAVGDGVGYPPRLIKASVIRFGVVSNADKRTRQRAGQGVTRMADDFFERSRFPGKTDAIRFRRRVMQTGDD
jgi:hypothetical protein